MANKKKSDPKQAKTEASKASSGAAEVLELTDPVSPAPDIVEDKADTKLDEDQIEADAGEMPEPEDAALDEASVDAPADADDASDHAHPEDGPPGPPDEAPPDPPAPEKIVERVIERRRGGFFPALIGGILAAGAGFVAGRGDMLDQFFPREDPTAEISASLEALSGNVAGQGETLDALGARIDGIEMPDIAPLTASLETLQAQSETLSEKLASLDAGLVGITEQVPALGTAIETLDTSVGGIDARLTTLEKRPVTEGVSKEAAAAYERELERYATELAALQSALDTQRDTLEAQITGQKDEVAGLIAAQKEEVAGLIAEAQAMEQEAAAAEARARAQTLVADIVSALDSGAPYADAVAELSAGGNAVDGALSGPAADGVPTLSELQSSFAGAARSALSAARATDDGGTGLGGFLKSSLGARSVTPRDGDDPDAVLSRIEAAVQAGALEDALTEIATLPEAAQSALSNWIESAETRQSAAQAAAALAQSLSAN